MGKKWSKEAKKKLKARRAELTGKIINSAQEVIGAAREAPTLTQDIDKCIAALYSLKNRVVAVSDDLGN